MLPHKRQSNYRPQNKLFVIVSEGRNTEKEYFEKILGKLVFDRVCIRCLPGKGGTSPDKVSDRLNHFRGSIRRTDEQWAVSDCDKWTPEQRKTLLDWAAARQPSQPFRGVVFNSPMFELWLLLHFQDVAPNDTAGAILNALKQCLPPFRKKSGCLLECAESFTAESFRTAIERARISCPDGKPRIAPNTTNAWVLVEHILESGGLGGSNATPPAP